VLNVLRSGHHGSDTRLGFGARGRQRAIGATPGEDLAPHIIHTVRAPDLISALSWLSSLRDSVPLPDGARHAGVYGAVI
jgi:hypothetical protein